MEYRYRKLSTVVRLLDGTTAFINRGDTLPDDIDPANLEHLLELGSLDVIGEGSPPPPPPADPADPPAVGFDARGKDADELADWLRSEQPTVDEVVAAAQGDPVAAAALLNAERTITEGEPRKGVVKGLDEVVEAS